MITVPDAFAARRIAVSGAEGRAWIEQLPQIVEQLCSRWQLNIDGQPMTGELGIVVPVLRCSQECALKVSWPDDPPTNEALALQIWAGNGAVDLYESDTELRAIVIERVDHTRPLSALPPHEAVEVAGRLLPRLAVAARDELYSMSQVTQRLTKWLPVLSARLGNPIPGDVMDLAMDTLGAHSPNSARRIVNTDLHYDNVLAAVRQPWLVIDPKIIAGEIEYGVAPLLWNLYGRVELAELGDHFHRLVELTGSEPAWARRWTIVRMVDYWLWAIETGLTNDPKMCEEIISLLRGL